MSTPYEGSEEQRDELVEQVAREIQLRGLTGPAVHFLEASRPYRALGANAMLFFDPVLRGVFGGDLASASEILADDTGIELLIARLEETDDEITWDACATAGGPAPTARGRTDRTGPCDDRRPGRAPRRVA